MFEGYGVGLAVAPRDAPRPSATARAERPFRLTDVLQVGTWAPATQAFELGRIQDVRSALAAYEVVLIAELAGARADFFDPSDDRPGRERPASWSEGGLAGVGEFLVDEVAQLLRCSVTEASIRAEQALLLTRHLTATWAALADGAIDWPRARAIAAELSEPVRRGDPARVVAAVEAAVLPGAMDAGVRALRTAVRRELVRLDAAAADRRRSEARRAAGVRVRPVGDGMSELVALMPHEDARAVAGTLDRYTRLARDAGDHTPLGMLRTGVLTDLVLRPWDTSRPAVTAALTVHAPLAALAGAPGADPATVDGEPVTGAALRELLDRLDAACPGRLRAPAGGSLDVAVTDPTTGALRAVVPARELRRLAARGCPEHPAGPCRCAVLGRPAAVAGYARSRPQRRYLDVRDRTCRMPGCARPTGGGATDHDHVVPHARGGPTDCANLCCLCERHHRLKTHARGWSFVMHHDGVLTVTTPSGVTRVTRPPGLRRSAAEEPPPF